MVDWNTVIIHRAPQSLTAWLLAVVTIVGAAGCASHPRSMVPAGTSEPDKFLFDKGTDSLHHKKLLTAREIFKQVAETYTASPFLPDANLGIGDTSPPEGTAQALAL